MFTFYRENGVLYAKCLIDNIVSSDFKDKVQPSFDPQMIEVDLFHKLVKRNERVLIEQNNDFIKPDLFDLEIALMEKKYEIKDIEKKKPISKEIVEEVSGDIQEEIEEIPEVKEKPENNNNNNKKQRHQRQ